MTMIVVFELIGILERMGKIMSLSSKQKEKKQKKSDELMTEMRMLIMQMRRKACRQARRVSGFLESG